MGVNGLNLLSLQIVSLLILCLTILTLLIGLLWAVRTFLLVSLIAFLSLLCGMPPDKVFP